jgi:hypothetical protein
MPPKALEEDGFFKIFIEQSLKYQDKTTEQLGELFDRINEISVKVQPISNMVSRIENIEKSGLQRFDLAMKEIKKNEAAISGLTCGVHDEKIANIEKDLLTLQIELKNAVRAIFKYAVLFAITVGGGLLGAFLIFKFGWK